MSQLTEEQYDAVRESRDVLLVACPGSGKTRTLVHRLARELEQSDSPRQYVVALTYTHVAADQIRDRLQDMGVDTTQLWIGTIHSFCLTWILRPYVIYSEDLSPGFQIVDLHESETLLDDIVHDFPPLKTRFDFDFFASVDGLQLSSKVKPQFRNAASKVVEAYEDRLKQSNKADFEMILQYSWNLVAQRPSIARRLGQLFRLVAVDEYQDTRLIQYKILSSISLLSDDTRLFFVGDPNQAIFESLGGVALSKSDLNDITGRDFREMPLTANFRNSRQIIEYYKRFAVNPQQLVAVGPMKDHLGDLVHDTSLGKGQLVESLVRLIKVNVDEKGVSPSEICIVAPWWVHLASLTRALVQKMPDYSFNGPGLSPFGQNADNFWYKVARLALTAAAPDLFAMRLRWASEVTHEMFDEGSPETVLSGRDLLRTLNGIHIEATLGSDFLARYFDKLSALFPDALQASEQMLAQKSFFLERMKVRIEMLREREGAEVDDVESFKRVFRPRNGIVVSTIHGVKGAEFDTVIAFGLLEGIVPHFSEASPAKDRSANRMLYVLCSRARKNLYLISEAGRGTDWYPKVQSEVLARASRYPYTSRNV